MLILRGSWTLGEGESWGWRTGRAPSGMGVGGGMRVGGGVDHGESDEEGPGDVAIVEKSSSSSLLQSLSLSSASGVGVVMIRTGMGRRRMK